MQDLRYGIMVLIVFTDRVTDIILVTFIYLSSFLNDINDIIMISMIYILSSYKDYYCIFEAK